MTLCGDGCIPCCDYCIYAIHDLWTDDMGVVYDQGACGCKKHLDPEHQEIVDARGHCEDFYCSRVRKVVS